MFYCSECATKNGWREGLFQSFGPCEVCGKTRECSDVPSKDLPAPRKLPEVSLPLEPLMVPLKLGTFITLKKPSS